MKRITVRLLTLAIAFVAAVVFTLPDAEARRLGGGKSFGRQSSGTMQRDAARPPQQQAAPAPTRAGAAPAQAAGNRWLAPIAGLAAGLGLAALASYLGLGEEMATVMLLALLAIVVFALVRRFAGKRPAGPQPAYQGGYSQSQLGQEATVRYSPLSQGGDAATTSRPGQAGPAMGASTGVPQAAHGLRIPDGFDVEGFERNAKVQFVRLQAVFDAADLDDLREFTTPEAYAELVLQIRERGAAANRTDVVTLDARLLGIETTANDHVASVHFSGMIREDADGEAKPFDEVWNLVKPVAGGGWVLAGIQQFD